MKLVLLKKQVKRREMKLLQKAFECDIILLINQDKAKILFKIICKSITHKHFNPVI